MSPTISRRRLLGAGSRAALGLALGGPLRGLGGGVTVEAAEPPTARGAAGGEFRSAFLRLDEFVARHMREVGAPGMTLALADRGGLVRVASYGLADLKRAARVRPETLFEIGSISKS
jgi:CubicO group peptidase (beta-lactamase class C family)